MQKISQDEVVDPLETVAAKIDQHDWQKNGTLALSGAGASLAVLLVALQLCATKFTDLGLWAVILSGLAVPLWMCVWQLIDTINFHKVDGAKVAKQINWVVVMTCSIFFAPVFLCIAIVLLIVEVNLYTGLVVSLALLMAVPLASPHLRSVKWLSRQAK